MLTFDSLLIMTTLFKEEADLTIHVNLPDLSRTLTQNKITGN